MSSLLSRSLSFFCCAESGLCPLVLSPFSLFAAMFGVANPLPASSVPCVFGTNTVQYSPSASSPNLSYQSHDSTFCALIRASNSFGIVSGVRKCISVPPFTSISFPNKNIPPAPSGDTNPRGRRVGLVVGEAVVGVVVSSCSSLVGVLCSACGRLISPCALLSASILGLLSSLQCLGT